MIIMMLQVVFLCQVDYTCMVSSIKWFHTTPDNITVTLIKVSWVKSGVKESRLSEWVFQRSLNGYLNKHLRRGAPNGMSK